MKSVVRSSHILVALALVACAGESNSPRMEAELRLLHASSNLGALDLNVGDRTLISSVPFGSASPVTRVPAGLQHLTVTVNKAIIGELDVELSTEHVNAVVVAAGVPQFSTDVVPDTGAAIANRANFRLVNVATSNTTPPTHLTVLLNFPDVSADSVARFGGYDATVARYWSLMYFDPGHFRIWYVPEGAITTVLAQAEFDIAAGEKKAAILERGSDGVYRVQIVVEP